MRGCVFLFVLFRSFLYIVLFSVILCFQSALMLDISSSLDNFDSKTKRMGYDSNFGIFRFHRFFLPMVELGNFVYFDIVHRLQVANVYIVWDPLKYNCQVRTEHSAPFHSHYVPTSTRWQANLWILAAIPNCTELPKIVTWNIFFGIKDSFKIFHWSPVFFRVLF